MPMKTVHCSLCGKPIKGTTFEKRMAKLRSHRKRVHPTAHKRSVAKGMVTKGYDRKWRTLAGLAKIAKSPARHRKFRKWKLDPLKVRKGLTKKPKVLSYADYNASGLIRVLHREDATFFPEFALYPKTIGGKLLGWRTKKSLKDAGFKQESRGKWVLRTNKFNIFVYI